jgi:hypothetical protein
MRKRFVRKIVDDDLKDDRQNQLYLGTNSLLLQAKVMHSLTQTIFQHLGASLRPIIRESGNQQNGIS